MLTSRLPWPLDKGDKLRAYHQIRSLSADHEVHLFCLVDSKPSAEAIASLTEITESLHWCKMRWTARYLRMLWAPFSRRPFQVHWFYQTHAAKQVSKLLKRLQPDVVYCQLIRMAEYVKNHHEYPRVLDYMDALSAGMLRRAHLTHWSSRWVYQIEAARLSKYEASTFDYFDSHTIISVADRKLISHPEKSIIQVVPNGVDKNYYQFQNSKISKEKGETSHSKIVFTGNMSYPPNIDAAIRLATKVLPETQTIPPLELIIAGTSPPSKLKQLNSERVQITGWIPDMRWAYHQAQIFVAPLRIGTGQQNKILEAMACGIPCITTSHVMSGFLSEQAKQTTAPPLVIADSLEEMVRAIDSLVSDQAKRKQLGEASRKWIEENASWDIQSRILMDSFVHSSKL
jgi:sugar transferase (PEP-CTERM/EpsH1 system associated)